MKKFLVVFSLMQIMAAAIGWIVIVLPWTRWFKKYATISPDNVNEREVKKEEGS